MRHPFGLGLWSGFRKGGASVLKYIATLFNLPRIPHLPSLTPKTPSEEFWDDIQGGKYEKVYP